MGRGLSKLQRYILREVAARPRLYYADILMGFFGWQPESPLVRDPDNPPSPPRGGFSVERLGPSRYRSTMAALSRSGERLDRRGLVTCLVPAKKGKWAAVEITDAGREYLSVNTQATELRLEANQACYRQLLALASLERVTGGAFCANFEGAPTSAPQTSSQEATKERESGTNGPGR
jgi:hypothetical protein